MLVLELLPPESKGTGEDRDAKGGTQSPVGQQERGLVEYEKIRLTKTAPGSPRMAANSLNRPMQTRIRTVTAISTIATIEDFLNTKVVEGWLRIVLSLSLPLTR